MELLNFFARWAHVLFGITWIGLLYYFNFVQTEYFKEAEPDAKADATAKLAPRALWWFRWGAMFTFLTGLVLLVGCGKTYGINAWIIMGALAGTFMFLNVWLIIWPNQQIVIGLKEGDKAAAAPKAGLASRTNTLFSGPMALGMLASHSAPGGIPQPIIHLGSVPTASPSLGLWICIALILALEANALFGKTGPMTSVKGVIHCSIGLALVMYGLIAYL